MGALQYTSPTVSRRSQASIKSPPVTNTSMGSGTPNVHFSWLEVNASYAWQIIDFYALIPLALSGFALYLSVAYFTAPVFVYAAAISFAFSVLDALNNARVSLTNFERTQDLKSEYEYLEEFMLKKLHKFKREVRRYVSQQFDFENVFNTENGFVDYGTEHKIAKNNSTTAGSWSTLAILGFTFGIRNKKVVDLKDLQDKGDEVSAQDFRRYHETRNHNAFIQRHGFKYAGYLFDLAFLCYQLHSMGAFGISGGWPFVCFAVFANAKNLKMVSGLASLIFIKLVAGTHSKYRSDTKLENKAEKYDLPVNYASNIHELRQRIIELGLIEDEPDIQDLARHTAPAAKPVLPSFKRMAQYIGVNTAFALATQEHCTDRIDAFLESDNQEIPKELKEDLFFTQVQIGAHSREFKYDQKVVNGKGIVQLK